jgi:phosphoglycolate phosphatase-like HAD superfamily hydrolase
MRHVIWDWNGTLFDDLPIVVDAVNASLVGLGASPIDVDDYRDHYTRPVRRFYETLLSRPVPTDEWARIDRHFHDEYRARLGEAGLTEDAAAAVGAVAAGGGTQSLLSMWWHAELVAAVGRYGLAHRMVRIDGNRGEGGDSKSEHLAAHVAALRAADGTLTLERCVVIGDSLDDARAAAAIGLPCVLYDGGSHHRRQLAGVGVPIADSLLHAVELGAVDDGRSPATVTVAP